MRSAMASARWLGGVAPRRDNPCLMAFREARSRPPADRGPVDLRLLIRFAIVCFRVAMWGAQGGRSMVGRGRCQGARPPCPYYRENREPQSLFPDNLRDLRGIPA